MTLACACSALSHGDSWPSSDLDGHVGMVELYRQALTQGILWPYDRSSGGGMDALPYYAWPWELLLALAAQGLQLVGVAHGSLWVCMSVMVMTMMALPMSAAWCCRAGVRAGTASRQAGHAGALAAWIFLATRSADGISGYGGDYASLGLLEQGVGWNLLLLLAGSLARPAGALGFDLRSGALVSLVFLVHSMSALCALMLVGVSAHREPRRALAVLTLGLSGAALSLGALWQVHGEVLAMPAWAHLSGEDALLAVLDPLCCGQGWRRALPGAGCLGAWALLLAAASGCVRAHRARAIRCWAGAAVMITLVGCLPLGRVLLPAAAQTYRVLPVALLLGLAAGASQAPAWCRLLRRRVRPGVALAGLAALWCGLGWQQLGCWSRDREASDPASLEAELAPVMPAGGRVLIADQIGWHRWMVERWKQDRQWESLSCFHPVVAPALVAAAAPAAQTLGIAMGAVTPLPGAPPGLAADILRDLGLEQVARRRAVGQRVWEDGFDRSWQRQDTAHYQVWSARAAAPRLEPIVCGLVGIDADLGAATPLLPAYAAQLRARLPQAPRLVWLPTTSPAADGLVLRGMISDLALTRGGVLEVPGLSGLALARGPLFRDESPVPAVWDTLVAAWAGVARFLQQLPLPPARVTAGAACSCQWLDLQRCRLRGMVVGQPYLLRYGYSDGMSSPTATLLREACGMTVVIPRTSRALITISCIHAPVVFGAAISLGSWTLVLAVGLGLTVRAWGRRQGEVRARVAMRCHP